MTLLIVIGLAGSGSAAGLSVLELRALDRAQSGWERLSTVRESYLQVDELTESLRADVHTWSGGFATDTAAVRDTGDELEQAAVRLVPQDGGPGEDVAAAELRYVAVSRELVAGPRPVAADRLAGFDRLAAEVTGQIDARHATLETERSRRQAALDAQERRSMIEVVLTTLTGGLVLAVAGLWVRRVLLGSLRGLVGVADRVSSGDLAARNDLVDEDEVGEVGRAFDRMTGALQHTLDLQDRDAERQRFRGRLDRALTHVDDEAGLSRTVSRTMAVIDAERPMELLLADSSEAHLTLFASSDTAGGPGCPVSSPWSCPAVRGGRAMQYTSSEELDACPQLHGRPGGETGAVCVPVSFMGRAMGVLHTTVPAGPGPEQHLVEQLQAVAEQSATRLGTLRAFERVNRQASVDALTGLLNRRSFEDAVHELAGAGRGYGLVLADLDHFKQVNDTYGHSAGDRALRVFAQVVRATLRTDDLAGRYGGEEFVLALPGLDAQGAADVVERIRTALAVRLQGSDGPALTASFGIADSTVAEAFAEQLARADDALLEAKRTGRDRALLAPLLRPAAAPPAPRQEPPAQPSWEPSGA